MVLCERAYAHNAAELTGYHLAARLARVVMRGRLR
jgi:hypothetical protein